MTGQITCRELAEAFEEIERFDLPTSRITMNVKDAESFGIFMCLNEDHSGYGGEVKHCTHDECTVRTVLER